MTDLENLKKVIVNALEWSPPKGVDRIVHLDLVEETRLLSVVGPRRAGKTYACFQFLHKQLTIIPKSNILYLNLEDERLYPLSKTVLQDLWETYLQVSQPEVTQPIYLILDEIQNIPNWSRWVRRMHDQYSMIRIIVTGSSSKLLSRELATELRGRAISIEVFPFSFPEFLRANGVTWNPKTVAYSTEKPKINHLFGEYFKRGGFPGILEATYPEKILQEYFKAMYVRDLIERFKIENIPLFEDFLRLQIQQFSAVTSISKMEKLLAEIGYSLSKNTLTNYIRYARESYILFQVPIYSNKIKNQLRYPKKTYAIDHGLLQAVRFSTSEDFGRLLENIVFMALRRKTTDIYYYQDKTCECDFLVKEKTQIVLAIQVAYTIKNNKTREREIKGLTQALLDNPNAKGLILTLDETDEIIINGKLIPILPVWRWLLEDEGPHIDDYKIAK